MKTKHWEKNNEDFCYNVGHECIFGDVFKEPKIVAFGNSHMEHMFRYLNQAGKMYGFSIRMIGSGGCAYMNDFMGDERCDKIKPLVDRWVQQSKIIIYSANYWSLEEPQQWRHGKTFKGVFSQFVDQSLKQHKKIIILKDIPDLNRYEVDRYFSYYLQHKPFQSEQFFTRKEVSGNEMMEKIAQEKGKNVIFFDPLDGLSQKEIRDWPIYKGILAYADGNHLNAYTASEFPKEVLPKQKIFWGKIVDEIKQ